MAELFSNIKLFEFNNLVCGDKNCNLYDSKNNLIFTDNTHLSYEFANVILPVFRGWISKMNILRIFSKFKSQNESCIYCRNFFNKSAYTQHVIKMCDAFAQLNHDLILCYQNLKVLTLRL